MGGDIVNRVDGKGKRTGRAPQFLLRVVDLNQQVAAGKRIANSTGDRAYDPTAGGGDDGLHLHGLCMPTNETTRFSAIVSAQ